MPARKLAGVFEAARYCDVDHKTIRDWIAKGLITGYRVGPKLLKVDMNEIDRVIIRPVSAAAGNGQGR